MPELRLSDFSYPLPPEAVPAYPLPERDRARLLVYRNGNIRHHTFHQLPDLLPQGAVLVFNDTRVIPARLFFKRQSGAKIEVLLLEPANKDIAQALQEEGHSDWEAIIGGVKKWKDGEWISLDLNGTVLQAVLLDRKKSIVRLQWDNSQPLASLLEKAGKLPLPPYLKRETEESDKDRYQTVYAVNKGAVAAPTAGLHFTDEVLNALKSKGYERIDITLHVGAGTFRPVKVDNPAEHDMHREHLQISRASILRLLNTTGPVIAVGTTSMRALESLYWWGCKLNGSPEAPFSIEKLLPYQISALPVEVALRNVLSYLDRNGLDTLQGETEILIMPGYTFGLCKGLISNFHLPESTLIMLVAAFVGDDWRKIYESALAESYRFLSFGDSSLLWRGLEL